MMIALKQNRALWDSVLIHVNSTKFAQKMPLALPNCTGQSVHVKMEIYQLTVPLIHYVRAIIHLNIYF